LVHDAVVRGELLSKSVKSALIKKFVEVNNVSRAVGRGDNALDILQGVNFYAHKGEIVSIVGPSGCGKSTFLNILAGLDQPDSGTVSISGIQSGDLLGNVGYMQQKDLLLPWRNILGNVILGLEVQGVPKKDAQMRAGKLMGDFGLSGFESNYPNSLSGGMKRRVAIARALVGSPRILLYDEPTAGLDPITSRTICDLIIKLRDLEGVASILVTHDLPSAVILAGEMARVSSTGEVMYVAEKGRFCLVNTSFVVLKDGSIIFEGSDEAMFASTDPYLVEFLT